MAEPTVENQTETDVETKTEEAAPVVEKTLSQAEVDNIVKERLSRERQKYSDYDDLKAKAAAADASKTDLEKLTEQIAELRTENEGNKLKALRSEVSGKKKVPVHLLTGNTQDELEAQADALLEFAKSGLKAEPQTALPKENLRSGAANNEREQSSADIAKSVLKQQRVY